MQLEMIGRLDECMLLSYAVDAERAARLVPDGLEPIVVGGSAFANVVASHIAGMRPSGVPRALGLDYWHVAYRIQVRAPVASGAAREGLFFLRSDADRRLLGWFGNRLSDFRFHTARVRWSAEGEGGGTLTVDRTTGGEADAVLQFAPSLAADELAEGSAFPSVAERERVLAYAPLGLAVDRSRRALRIARVIRDVTAWREAPVQVARAEWAALRTLGLEPHRLERATRVAPLDYRWRLGERERLAGAEEVGSR